MGVCTSQDPFTKKFKEFLKNYKQFNNVELNNSASNTNLKIKSLRSYNNYQGLEAKLYEHYKIFFKYKEELYKTNRDIHDRLFLNSIYSKNLNTSNISTNKSKDELDEDFNNVNNNFIANNKNSFVKKFIKISNLKRDDEEKFLFFFNLGGYTSVEIIDSNISFPRFYMAYFPKFASSESLLRKIVINDSIILFEESKDSYIKLIKVRYLDLSYNKIEKIPSLITKLKNLKCLILRRNLLSILSNDFKLLNSLVSLDLSENKFKAIPECLFELPSLETLNLNVNYIDNLDVQGLIVNSIKYFYLANNNFTQIPHDLAKIKNLNHLALDSNKITEINPNLLIDVNSSIKITVANNSIKNKVGDFYKIKNDVLTILNTETSKEDDTLTNNINQNPKIEINKNDTVNSQPKLNKQAKVTFANVQNLNSEEIYSNTPNDEDINKNNEKLFNEKKGILDLRKEKELQDFKNKKTKIIKEITFSDNVPNLIENNINKKVVYELEMYDLPLSLDDNQITEKLVNKKKEVLKEQLLNLINKRQDHEMAKFQSNALKLELKNIYYEVTKERILKSWKVNENPNDVTDDNLKSIKEKYSKNSDLENLVFLKNLNDSITTSKIKLALQYLRNLDPLLCYNLKNLIDEHDVSSLIIRLTELKLFLLELIEYYEQNGVGRVEIVYEYKIFNSTSVIYKIFQDTFTLKMLYNLGLYEIKKTNNYEIVCIQINNVVNVKHKLIENFFGRFINEIKNLKVVILID